MVKANNLITSGAKNVYNMVERVQKLQDSETWEIAMRYLQTNTFSAHSDNILICMLGDEDEEVRNQTVNKISRIRDETEDSSNVDCDDIWGGDIKDEETEDREVSEESNLKY